MTTLPPGSRIQPILLCSGQLADGALWAAAAGAGPATAPGTALALPSARGLRVEQALQAVELQEPGEDDDAALSHRPPVDVALVGLQEEGIGPFPHPGEVVEPPHVEDVALQLLGAELREGDTGPWPSPALAEPCLELSARLSLKLSCSLTPVWVPLGGRAQPRCIRAPCGHPDTHPNCLQGVVQLFPLSQLFVFHSEAFIVDTKAQIHLHEAKVVLLVVQAQLVKPCGEK